MLHCLVCRFPINGVPQKLYLVFLCKMMRRERNDSCESVEELGKALWLEEVNCEWWWGRRMILTTIMWLHQVLPLLWPGAHVQIWGLVIGLLPRVAKVKLLCALCCCFLRVNVVFCSTIPCFITTVGGGVEGQQELHLFDCCLFQFEVHVWVTLFNIFSLYNIPFLLFTVWSCLNSCSQK